ncbi:hypothetical protein SAJA_04160 [Salinisphaera japonica YTM-1]|uniref:Uncharacterized protein n=1 Tax=Salinisphaera japonica YTM-1 TaxID=1209778 RepID=A0A423PZ23_9GAMM|nr:hypothetical protein SAJA_04160 [Salinisphaera japonica YTM-1]
MRAKCSWINHDTVPNGHEKMIDDARMALARRFNRA